MLIPIQLILTGLLALLAALHGPDLLDVLGIDVLIDGVVTGVVVARDRTNYLVRTVVDSAVSSTVKLLDALPQATLQDCGRVDVVYVPVFVGNVSMDLDDMVCPAVWGVFMTSDIVLPAASASSSLLIEGRDASFAPLVNVVNTSQPLPWTLFTAQPASTVGVFTMPSTHPLEGITFFGLISGLLIMPVVAVAFLVKHRVTSKIRKQLNVEAGPRASPFNPAIPDTPKPSKPHTTTSETPETFYVDLEYTPDPVEFMFVFTDVSDFLLGLVKDVVLPSSISEEDETLGNFNSFYEIMAELKLVPSVLESVDACGQQSPVLLSPSTPSNLVEDIQVSSSPIVQDNIPTTVPNTTSPAPPAASSPSPLLPAFSLSLLPGSKSLIAQPSTRSSKSWTWAIDLYLSIRSQKMQDSEPAQSASPDPTRYREMPYCRNGELKEGIVDTHVGWNEPLAFPDAAEENDPVPRSVARERLYDVMHSGVARKTSGASVEPMHNPRTRRRKRRRKGDAPNVTESSGATADSEALTTSASAPEAAQPVARVPLRQRPLIARAGLAAIRGVLVPSPRRPRASAVAPVSPVAPPPPPPRITSIVVHNAIPSSQPGLLPPRSPILPPSDDPWKPLIRSDESSSPSAASSKLPTPRVRVPPPSHEPPNTPRGPAMTVEQSLFNVPVRVVSGKRGKGKQVSQPMVFHDALDSLQELPKESIAPATM